MLLIIFFLILLYTVLQTIYTGYYSMQARKLNQTSWSGKRELGEKTKPVFRLFIAGDSVGAGVGSTSFETSLAGRLANYFAQDHFVHYENVAVTGDRMANLVNRPVPNEIQDLTVLIVSSNDHFRFVNYKDFEESTKKVFERYASKSKRLIIIGPGNIAEPRTIPLVVKPIYYFRGPKYAEILNRNSATFENITHVNPLKPPEGLPNYGHTYAADNFHPNDEGHRFWFDMIRLGGKL